MYKASLINLIQREYLFNKTTIFWSLSLTLLTLLLCALLNWQVDINGINITGQLISLVYLVFGAYFANITFKEFLTKSQLQEYLTLPTSLCEKVSSKFIFYIFFSLLAFIFLWLIACALSLLIISLQAGWSNFNLANFYLPLLELMSNFLAYLSIYSLIVFAITYFKRLALIKLAIIYLIIILPLKTIISHQAVILITHFFAASSQLLISLLSGTSYLLLSFGLWLLIYLSLKAVEIK